MDKTRLVNLSDGTFAIVLTLLVLDIRIPMHALTDQELIHQLLALSPVFLAYFTSFTVLAMFWISHNFFYDSLSRTIDRKLILLNMTFLAFLSLIPFSARLLGEYPGVAIATAVYGVNVLLIGIVYSIMFEYALSSKEIDSAMISSRTLKQARIRRFVTTGFSFAGILSSFISFPLALVLYAFPIIFNTIPGLLNAVERFFGFEIA